MRVNIYLSLCLAWLPAWLWAQKQPLPPPINTAAIEYAPTVSADGRTMIFETNRNNGKWELYVSYLRDGKWTTPEPIDSVNAYGSETDLIGGPSISYDGNTLYFFASFKNGYGREDIYYSQRIGNKWSKPKNIGPIINTPAYEGFPCISADGKTLYFIRESTNEDNKIITRGDAICYRIFVSEKGKDGEWQKPYPLPIPINLGCEKAPRIMSDNVTLIFSSIREGGIGEFDLYLSRRNEEGDWSTPILMDFASTPERDQFASVSASGDLLYFVTKDDIYTVPIPPKFRQNRNITIQGYIRDGETKQPLSAHVNVYNAETTERLMRLENNPSDGRYTIVLSEGKRYTIEIEKPGYTVYFFEFDLRKLDKYQEFERNIELFPTAEVYINTIDRLIFEPIDAQIIALKQGGGGQQIAQQQTKNGRSSLKLPIGGTYQIKVQADNYIDTTFVIDLNKKVQYNVVEKDAILRPKTKEYEIVVKDLETGEGLPFTVVLVNRNRNEVITLDENSSSTPGYYKLPIRESDEYELEVRNPVGYTFYSDKNPVISAKDPNRKKVIELASLKVGTKLTLNNIYFETGSAELSDASENELKKVIELMQRNPTLKIELAAHTDDRGSEAFNLQLSKARAQSVFNYLKKFGIPEERMVPKGYGKSQPVVPNDSDENRAKNRRCELIVISI
ncbi:outer membrane protein OmpA-like peptidoglycan-associated protein [Thermonema lapsum]|uniref:Outer membrane protein OmpA-like peptidoglycan-associated protein n=1 Tax=Thermonema lapsum TaxID=28195 RepID=A0A846MN64_9BACT|nr:OmpA family protein [Thermonema lapsum]NIK72993.1 outer membrane protein OmpA-like peptidoglycan-associated protein [Thermonema lapsum]